MCTGDDEPSDKDLDSKMVSSETQALYKNAVCNLGSVLEAEKEQNPNTKIMYHTIEDDPSSPGAFTLTQTHTVVFNSTSQTTEGEGAGLPGSKPLLQSQIAAVVPMAIWETHGTSIVWSVKKAASGIMPIRPQVLLTKEVVLEAKQALTL